MGAPGLGKPEDAVEEGDRDVAVDGVNAPEVRDAGPPRDKLILAQTEIWHLGLTELTAAPDQHASHSFFPLFFIY